MKYARKVVLTALFLFVIVYVVLFRLSEVRELISLVETMNPLYFALAVILQGLTFILIAMLLNELLRIYDHKLPLIYLVQQSLILNFINKAVPSGGVSGGAVLAKSLTHKEISGTQAGIVTGAAYILYNVGFLILLLAGYAGLFFREELSLSTVRITTLVVGIMILAVWTLILVFGDKNKFLSRSFVLVRVVNRLLIPFFKRNVVGEEGAKVFIDSLYQGMSSLFLKKRKLFIAGAISVAQHLTHILTLYVIFLGFGREVGLSVLAVAYVLANIFALASFFISGLGVYEASMVSILAGLGTPFEATVASVLVYRLLSFFAPLPIGFWLYRGKS